MNIKQLLCSTIIAIASLVLQTQTHAITLYKWVSPDGKVTYQDQPPPDGQAFEEKELQAPVVSTESEEQNAIGRAAAKSPINFFTVPNCDACELTQNILERNKLPFKLLNVENNAEVQNTLQNLTGSLRVPVVTIGETVVNGFNRDELNQALKNNNYPISPQSDPQ